MENIDSNKLKQNEHNVSSDQEFQNCQMPVSFNKDQTINNLANTITNEDIIDQKQQIRQPQQQQLNTEEQALQQIIKEQQLQQQQSIQYQESEIQNDSESHYHAQISPSKIQTQNEKIKSLHKTVSQQQQNSQISSQIRLSKTQSTDDRHSKNFNKIVSSSVPIKFLQSNSPQLFVSPLSMLPNEIVCIENNSTRIIVHMNKKIVPIPSSYQNDGKTKRESPQKNRTTLPSVQHPYLMGKLIVTNYKLAYIDTYYPNTMTFCLPFNYILKFERTNQQSTGISYLQIWFKNGLSIKMKFHQDEFSYSLKLKDIISTLVNKNLFAAVDFGQQPSNKIHLCRNYTQKYFNEQQVRKLIKGIDAEIMQNNNWQQMSGYPQRYVVPLRFIGKRNTETRIVVLSYVYQIQNQKICLWRTGPGIPDPFEDQWISKARFSTNHYIIQVKNKGIGISKSQAHQFIQIESLYLLRQSFFKVHQLTYHNHESFKWLGNICATKWYEQVVTLMNEAMHVIQIMSSKTNVTLVSDSEARGAQISSIVQLLMNPFYRTFQGFPYLIEKEFLHFECPRSAKKQRQEDKSVILIQFFDCVFQFTHLYPLSFQFNEHYLVFLAEHVFSNKYGNFLYATRQLKKQTDRRQVVEKCVCIWEDIRRKIETDKKIFMETQEIGKALNRKANRKSINPSPIHELINYYIYFRNSFFIDHNQSNIFELRNHSQVSKGIKLWTSYFCKKVYCSESIKEQVLFCNQIQKRYFKISYQHNLMKKYNEIMRKKLSQQYAKIALKKQQIKNLKQL